MERWDQDFVDADVPGFFEIKKNGLANFSSATFDVTLNGEKVNTLALRPSSSASKDSTKWNQLQVEVGQSSTERS